MSFPLTPIHPRTARTTPRATNAQPATSRGEPDRRVRTRSMTFLSEGQGGEDPPREQGKSGGDGDDGGDGAVVASFDGSGAAHVLRHQSPTGWHGNGRSSGGHDGGRGGRPEDGPGHGADELVDRRSGQRRR